MTLLTFSLDIISSSLSVLWKASHAYFIWVLIHWLSANIYHEYCAPSTWYGLLFGTTVLSQTPVCTTVLWLLTHSSKMISNMWIVGVTFLVMNLNRNR